MNRHHFCTTLTLIGMPLLLSLQSEADVFKNLDFEGVVLPHQYSAARLFPGWFVGGVSNAGLNEPVAWHNSMIIYDDDCALQIPFEGRYGLALFPSPEPTGNIGDPPRIQTLGQMGDLPADAGIIYFKNWGERVRVFLGEQEIPISYSGDRGVGDISAFAGQNVTLKFQTLPATTWPQYSALDSIWFSPIPEPSTLALFGVGGVVLCWCLRRKLI